MSIHITSINQKILKISNALTELFQSHFIQLIDLVLRILVKLGENDLLSLQDSSDLLYCLFIVHISFRDFKDFFQYELEDVAEQQITSNFYFRINLACQILKKYKRAQQNSKKVYVIVDSDWEGERPIVFIKIYLPQISIIQKLIVIIIFMKSISKNSKRARVQCSICFDRIANTSLEACSHLFCIRCIKKWAKTRTTCPLCRKLFLRIHYKNRIIEFPQSPSSLPPTSTNVLQSRQERRIIYVPFFMYPQVNYMIYPSVNNFMIEQGLQQNSGINLPLGSPSYLIPTL